MKIVAIDLGFGATKAYTDGKSSVFPSEVAIPIPALGLAGMGLKTTKKRPMRIKFSGGDFYAGYGAHAWGNTIENLDFSRIASHEVMALFYAAVAPLVNYEETVKLVLGFPVPFLRDEAVARPALEALKARLLREHTFELDGHVYKFSVAHLKGAAQPVGAWADWALTAEGVWVSKEAQRAKVGVIDIGFNTLDLYGIQGGKLEPKMVGGDKTGIRRYLEILSPPMSLFEASERLASGQLHDETARNIWLSEVIGVCERVWSNSRLDLVILVGGGAMLLEPVKEQFERAFKAPVVVPVDPIMANARGLWKWALTVKWS